MKKAFAAVLLFILAWLAAGQNPEPDLACSDIDKIHKAVYKAYKRAKANDTAYYEGFFILKIANPFNPTHNQVLMSSTDHVKMFGDKLLTKLDNNKFPAVDSAVNEILIPIINFVRCKKHNHGSLEGFQLQMKNYLEDERMKATDSVLILKEIITIGYHN